MNHDLSKEISKVVENDYPLFAAYCNYLGEGLRKEALKCLNEFLELTFDWDYSAKAVFCKMLFSIKYDIKGVLSFNLNDTLLAPVLLKMAIKEPDNYLPLKWYGQYFSETTSLKKAYKLNPYDNSLNVLLLKNLENELWLSTHHLPEHYLGTLDEDEQVIKLAFSLIENLNKEISANYTKTFTSLKNEIENYKSNNNLNITTNDH